MHKLVKLLASIGVSLLAGALGSLATIPNISTWYAGLHQPSFTPPNWVFGPVWTLLYVLMGIALYKVWTTPAAKPKTWAYVAFALQLALNVLWSFVFFGWHATWGGVAIILALLIAVLCTAGLFWRVSRLAAGLLAPYILWICFASCLNIGVAILN